MASVTAGDNPTQDPFPPKRTVDLSEHIQPSDLSDKIRFDIVELAAISTEAWHSSQRARSLRATVLLGI